MFGKYCKNTNEKTLFHRRNLVCSVEWEREEKNRFDYYELRFCSNNIVAIADSGTRNVMLFTILITTLSRQPVVCTYTAFLAYRASNTNVPKE